jgi:hypothetical protein
MRRAWLREVLRALSRRRLSFDPRGRPREERAVNSDAAMS